MCRTLFSLAIVQTPTPRDIVTCHSQPQQSCKSTTRLAVAATEASVYVLRSNDRERPATTTRSANWKIALFVTFYRSFLEPIDLSPASIIDSKLCIAKNTTTAWLNAVESMETTKLYLMDRRRKEQEEASRTNGSGTIWQLLQRSVTRIGHHTASLSSRYGRLGVLKWLPSPGSALPLGWGL